MTSLPIIMELDIDLDLELEYTRPPSPPLSLGARLLRRYLLQTNFPYEVTNELVLELRRNMSKTGAPVDIVIRNYILDRAYQSDVEEHHR